MKKLILFMLMFSGSAFAAGDASEERCDNPGSGVTCHCSEPLTVDDGSQTGSFNPSGSTNPATECDGGVFPLGTSTATWVDASSTGLTVGGSGKVMNGAGGWNVDDENLTFTNGTFCSRYYFRMNSANCTYDCNFKGPRFEVGGATGIGIETNTERGTSTPRLDHAFPYTDPDSGTCAEGCVWASWAKNTGSDQPTWSDLNSGWIRWDICVDHNLSQAGVDLLNATYNPNPPLTRTSANQVFYRARQTMVTGPAKGKTVLFGPTRNSGSQTVIRTGATTRPASVGIQGFPIRCVSPTTCGSPPHECFTNDAECTGGNPSGWSGSNNLAYVMTATKATADPTYWIGAATEVEGGSPTIPTPTETEGVDLTGVSISAIFPWLDADKYAWMFQP